MTRLDKYFLLAAVVVGIAASTVYVLAVREVSPPDGDWWISKVLGVVIVSAGALSAALAVTILGFAVATQEPMGFWLRLRLIFANLLKLYASALIVLIGLRLGNWVALSPHFLVTWEVLLAIGIGAILGLLSYVANALTPHFRRND